MTDIVARLRACDNAHSIGKTKVLCADAADEIERLRNKLTKEFCVMLYAGKCAERADKAERICDELRAEIAALKKGKTDD